MKFWDSIVIFAEYDTLSKAMAMRGLLEGMSITVHLIVVDCEEHVQRFLSGDYPQADFVIWCTHGARDEEGRAVLQPTIGEATGKTEDGLDEFADVRRQIGSREVREGCTGPRDTFITTACHSADEGLAAAFLDAGWRNYIGTNVTAESSSVLTFLAVFFSLLRAEDRDRPEERRSYTVNEAAAIARQADDFPLQGTRAFVSYHRGDRSD